MDDFRRQQNEICDVGGIHCNCCNCYRGKNRAMLNRFARRKLKKETEIEISESMNEMEIKWNLHAENYTK